MSSIIRNLTKLTPPPLPAPKPEEEFDEFAKERNAQAAAAHNQWEGWVNGSTERQARFNPAAVDQRFAARVQNDNEFKNQHLLRTGKLPEETQNDGVKRYAPQIRRKQFAEEQANRYRKQLADGSMTMQDIMQANPHDDKGKGIGDLRIMAQAQDRAQRGINVDKNWDQINRARVLGVPRGMVMMMDSIQQDIAAGNNAAAAAKAAMAGGMFGDRESANEFSKNLLAAEAAKAQAAAKVAAEQEPNVMVEHEKAMKLAHGQKPGARLTSLRAAHQLALGGPQADPKAVDAALRNDFQPHAHEMMSRGLANMTPAERIEMQQISGSMGYREWLQYVGLPDTIESEDAYRSITGKNASWRQGNEQRGVIGTLTDWAVPDFLFPGWK